MIIGIYKDTLVNRRGADKAVLALADGLRGIWKRMASRPISHYPTPPHLQGAYAEWSGRSYPITEKIHCEVLSLPTGPTLTDKEAWQIIEAVNGFRK